jgi:hypothetical protein
MSLNNYIFISQTIFGAIITCLSLLLFVNMKDLLIMTIETQLQLLWTLVASILLIYGMIQLSQGFVEMIEASKEK